MSVNQIEIIDEGAQRGEGFDSLVLRSATCPVLDILCRRAIRDITTTLCLVATLRRHVAGFAIPGGPFPGGLTWSFWPPLSRNWARA
jgi:hypothetical protein